MTIYLDHHATTPVDPRVVEAMLPFFTERFGNAASTGHSFGWDAAEAVDQARQSLARDLNVTPREIVFTSGATESNNLALRGIAERVRRRGNHLVSVATEHKAILDPLKKLGRRGFDITLLDVESDGSDRAGWLDPQRVADALRDDTVLVTVMLANNEIGVLQPLTDIGKLCRERGIPLHTDATQAVGRIPVDFPALEVDLASFSAHKFYGPKGVGALYVRRSSPPIRLEALFDGGGHELGRRSGTLNVPGIVGMARALEISCSEGVEERRRLRTLRDRLWKLLQDQIEDVHLNGPALETEFRLPGNLNSSFGGIDGEALMMSVREIAVSSGSACTSADPEPSHVLRALGLTDEATRGSLRFGVGRGNTVEEIEAAAAALAEGVARLRRMVGR